MIYIDLDGTLLDVFDRYYGIFIEYARNIGVSISKEEYIQFRHHGLSENEMLRRCYGKEINVLSWKQYKRERLEKREWLLKDFVIGNPQIIRECTVPCTLITQRRNKTEAFYQIDRLKLTELFEQVVVLEPLQQGNSKLEYLSRRVTKGDAIIGDSKIELECARKLGITGYFVKSGLFGIDIVENETICDNYEECLRKFIE